ncbi:hypothetical protein [Streptomyces sp. NPDC001380]|uniref:hypothetical protein n=1 Tax=Streptomyces sp. NPDC001380 TaxID=3364566 RepID=UPI003678B455
MKIKLLALPAAGALLAFGAAACTGGSDDTAQLDAWAKKLCGTAGAPYARSQDAQADLGRVRQGESPDDLRKRLSADMAAQAQAARQIAAALDGAGAPKADGGAQLQQQVLRGLRDAAAGFGQVQQKVDSLPTDDQARFADGLRSVKDQIQQPAQLYGSAVRRLQAGRTGESIARQPGCLAPAGGSAPAQAPSGSPAASPSSAAPQG